MRSLVPDEILLSSLGDDTSSSFRRMAKKLEISEQVFALAERMRRATLEHKREGAFDLFFS